MREKNVPTKLSVYVYNPDPNGENCIPDRNLRANVYLLIFLLNLASYARSPFTSRDREIKATTERKKAFKDGEKYLRSVLSICRLSRVIHAWMLLISLCPGSQTSKRSA